MSRTMQLSLISPLVGVIALLVWPLTSPNAQEDASAELRRRISELESKVVELEAELAHCRESGNLQPGSQYGWQNTKNWRRLEIGMPAERVKDILGEPVKVIKGVKILWYYPNIYCGYVAFDRSGQLTDWNEP
jgi:hypothetical protein